MAPFVGTHGKVPNAVPAFATKSSRCKKLSTC